MDGALKPGEGWPLLLGEYPAPESCRASARMACNLSDVDDGTVIVSWDESAHIPPVSGG